MFKVLIVEDEDLIRKGLAYTIDWSKMGCMVVGEACNGEEGSKKIKDIHPDLVITDIKMPKIDGLQMLQNFKERDFEVIIITGYGEFEYAKKAIELNVFDYLLKPIDEDKLYEVVGEVTKRISEKEIFRQFKNNVKDIENIKVLDTEIYCQNSSYKYKNTPILIDYIVNNYPNKISIEDIADQLEVSSSYLSKKFKDDTCHKFNDFLNSYRIQKAISLLTEGSYKVYEIAEMVGFSDYKYFSYVFKSYIHCSPMEFMKSNFLIRGADTENDTARND